MVRLVRQGGGLLHAGHNVSKQQFESGATFLDLMRGNLENLRIGLGYHGK